MNQARIPWPISSWVVPHGMVWVSADFAWLRRLSPGVKEMSCKSGALWFCRSPCNFSIHCLSLSRQPCAICDVSPAGRCVLLRGMFGKSQTHMYSICLPLIQPVLEGRGRPDRQEPPLERRTPCKGCSLL